jgi:hypothetical protein
MRRAPAVSAAHRASTEGALAQRALLAAGNAKSCTRVATGTRDTCWARSALVSSGRDDFAVSGAALPPGAARQ